MPISSRKPDSEASRVDEDFDALEDALRELPPDRQEAFEDWLDEQAEEETPDAGRPATPDDR